MNTKHELNQLNRIEEFAPIFTVNDHKIYFLIKRIFDLAITLSALIILLPIILLISILIALDSKGPIFFIQERVGSKRKHNKGEVYWQPVIFNCLKFRTMKRDADESIQLPLRCQQGAI